MILRSAVILQRKTKIRDCYCLFVIAILVLVWSFLIHLSAQSLSLSLSLSQYSKRLRGGHQLKYLTPLSPSPHSAHERRRVSSVKPPLGTMLMLSLALQKPRSLRISNWQSSRFARSKLDLKWIWLCLPITALCLDRLRPGRCSKHIITPIWHMRRAAAK